MGGVQMELAGIAGAEVECQKMKAAALLAAVTNFWYTAKPWEKTPRYRSASTTKNMPAARSLLASLDRSAK
ncbi:hypothetical protein ERY430_70064 [Erythrobacter sp. EC-HK427]|nr:hypothetical protein ERY430_70064 [Erythrobacter sp. EC-HK427]